MSTKEQWVYIFKDPNIILNSIEPKLPKQAMAIAQLLKEKGSVKRPELLGELQSVVKTKQRGGVNRILAYYQGLLERRGVLELRKKPD
jgi:hypothetical protein|tara:strand:+ start:202 stop:465 length:264 start_codon:yes stop_codon:yes gene_type:complete